MEAAGAWDGDVSRWSCRNRCWCRVPTQGGNITSRYFTPHACHKAHAVTGALAVATAAVLPARWRTLRRTARILRRRARPSSILRGASRGPRQPTARARRRWSSARLSCARRGASSKASCTCRTRFSTDFVRSTLLRHLFVPFWSVLPAWARHRPPQGCGRPSATARGNPPAWSASWRSTASTSARSRRVSPPRPDPNRVQPVSKAI